jgi:hypothetical protein
LFALVISLNEITLTLSSRRETGDAAAGHLAESALRDYSVGGRRVGDPAGADTARGGGGGLVAVVEKGQSVKRVARDFGEGAAVHRKFSTNIKLDFGGSISVYKIDRRSGDTVSPRDQLLTVVTGVRPRLAKSKKYRTPGDANTPGDPATK